MSSPDTESDINSSTGTVRVGLFFGMTFVERSLCSIHIQHSPLSPRCLSCHYYCLSLSLFGSPHHHTPLFSTSISSLPPKYVSWPCSFDHLMRSIPSLTRFFFSSILRFFLGVVLANLSFSVLLLFSFWRSLGTRLQFRKLTSGYQRITTGKHPLSDF